MVEDFLDIQYAKMQCTFLCTNGQSFRPDPLKKNGIRSPDPTFEIMLIWILGLLNIGITITLYINTNKCTYIQKIKILFSLFSVAGSPIARNCFVYIPDAAVIVPDANVLQMPEGSRITREG